MSEEVSSAPHLGPLERVRSLAEALVAIVKDRGNCALLPDALIVEVIARTSGKAAGYWSLPGNDLLAFGLVAHEPATRELCRESGVIVWAADPSLHVKLRRTMLVGAEWLKTPADKLAHMQNWDGGQCCRFCAIPVGLGAIELAALEEPTKPLGICNDRPILTPGRVHVHPDLRSADNAILEGRCESEWRRWAAEVESNKAALSAPTKAATPRLKKERAA